MTMIAPMGDLPLWKAAPSEGDARPDDPPFLRHPDPDRPLEARFKRFHFANPHICRELERRALELYRRGEPRIAIADLVEDIRKDPLLRTSGDCWKVNNSWRSYYTRTLCYKHPELENVMEVRELKNRRKKEGASA